MKLNALAASLLLFGLAPAAMAGSIRCGGQIIQDGQEVPVTQSQVRQLCGQPTSIDVETWIYVRDNVTYALQFNSNSQLVQITQQIKE